MQMKASSARDYGSTSVTQSSIEPGSELNFFGAVGVKFKQDSLTDLSLGISDSLRYNTTANSLFEGEDVDFEVQNLSQLQIDEIDKAIKFQDIKKPEQRLGIFGRLDSNYYEDDDAVMQWKYLKNKGFTPESFKNRVNDDTRKQYNDYDKHLRYYSEDNPVAGTVAEFSGSVGTFVADPINLMGFGAEILAFDILKAVGKIKKGAELIDGKVLDKSMLKTKKNINENIGRKDVDFMTDAGVINELQNLKVKSDAIAMKKFKSNTKREISEDHFENISNYAKYKAELKAEKDTFKDKEFAEQVLSKLENKGFKKDKTREYVQNVYNKSALGQAVGLGAVGGGIAVATEGARQLSTFDTKGAVLNGEGVPSYTSQNAVNDVLLSGLAGFGVVSAFDLLGAVMHTSAKVDILELEPLQEADMFNATLKGQVKGDVSQAIDFLERDGFLENIALNTRRVADADLGHVVVGSEIATSDIDAKPQSAQSAQSAQKQEEVINTRNDAVDVETKYNDGTLDETTTQTVKEFKELELIRNCLIQGL